MRILAATAALLFTFVAQVGWNPAASESYPDRPIKLIVPYTAGGATDILARVLGAELRAELGPNTSVVVENQAGASGDIGTRRAAQSHADGYTLLLTTDSNITTNPHIRQLQFNPLTDLELIAPLVNVVLCLAVNSSVKANSLAELIALVRASPNPFPFAVAGTGSPLHMAALSLAREAKLSLTHVKYAGGGQATVDLVAGHVPAAFLGIPPIVAFAKEGKVRILGVNGNARLPQYPDVPAITEVVPGFKAGAWLGLFGPKGMPPDVMSRLRKAVGVAMKSPSVTEKLGQFGMVVIDVDVDTFKKQIAKESQDQGVLIKENISQFE